MTRLIKDLAINALAVARRYPTPLTDDSNLRELLHKLRPVTSDKNLIRLGPNGDGGYLLPDDFAGIEACFSPGVDRVCGFERDCADRGMQVFLADRSVDHPPESHERFHFTKKHVGITTNDEFMTIDDWVSTSLGGSLADLLLQMDIEGFEYETFCGASDLLMRRLRIIVAEFHMLDSLWSWPFFQLASRAFDKILQTHTCVHIHPNNCCGSRRKQQIEIPCMAEFTFLRNDRINQRSFATVFPHPLDYDNTVNPALPLPECWYHG